MKIFAIDPGDKMSAYVVYEEGRILEHDRVYNSVMLIRLLESLADELAIEMIASYGMPVGRTVFDTCVWIGRFIELWHGQSKSWVLVYRNQVKMHLCHSMRAKDGNIRQAIIDLYPASGGGKIPQIGTKNEPGPLYGISGDEWSALAVARTFDECYSEITEKQKM